MDGRISLERVMNELQAVDKIVSALQSPSYVIKQQVIQLLIDLCANRKDGIERVIEIINSYQKIRKKRYRFEFIVIELEQSGNISDYQIVLITFINRIIVSTPLLIDRIRIRNEFKSVNLLPILYNLRKSTNNSEMGIEIDRFDEQLIRDEMNLIPSRQQIDRNSPIELFYSIFREISKTPHEYSFVTILQHLCNIDNSRDLSDKIWDIIERFVFISLSISDSNQYYEQFLNFIKNFRKESSCSGPESKNMPPPPPPPPLKVFKSETNEFRDNKRLKTAEKSLLTLSPEEKLPQQITPKPSLKMKTINWNKIPTNRIMGKQNLWTLIASNHSERDPELNWSEMENLFCQANLQSLPDSDNGHSFEKLKRKDSQEIRILESKKSLNVNIFLKQFKCSNNDIIKLIENGQHECIGSEKLRTLLKILPEFDELEILKAFDGDLSKLGNAEQFMLQLIQVANYKLRLESMLVKSEFTTNMSFLSPSINSMILAADDLMTNKELHEVLYMVLMAGNFLNSGGYAGDAAGIKLSSLQKLTDIRANKPNMNLVHYVAIQAERKDKQLLSFVDKIGIIEDAAKITMEQLYNEISNLDNRIRNLKKQIAQPEIETDIKMQMDDFLKTSEIEVKILQKKMNQLESIKRSLAEFFCEDVTVFKFEECFRIFHNFYVKFRQAIAENQRRKYQEEQMHLRRQQREELLALKRQQLCDKMDCEDLLETQIYESMAGNPHKKFSRDDVSLSGSPYFQRRRFGSFNNTQNDDNKFSPDITPNGSLRRRRNRVLCDEDDTNLMEFLRSSDQRERKVYGSLDRSWSRFLTHGTNKTRPSLPTTNPSVETKSTKIESEELEMTPKDLRQKIENWLQTTESIPITGHPKSSVPPISDNCKAMDTLHEEKSSQSIETQENDRKELIASLGQKASDDKVTIYIRSDPVTKNASRFNTLPKNYQKSRPVNSTCWKSDVNDENDETCGKFDRFSSIRRTKRYKKGINVVKDINENQTVKTSDNDEGFEESHSLMSEAASQATSNSNCETEPTSIELVVQPESPKVIPKPKTTNTSTLRQKLVSKTAKTIEESRSKSSSLSSFNSVNTVRKLPAVRGQLATLKPNKQQQQQQQQRTGIGKVQNSAVCARVATVAAKPATSRSFEPAFMKPTTSSTTKSNLNRKLYSFRSSVSK